MGWRRWLIYYWCWHYLISPLISTLISWRVCCWLVVWSNWCRFDCDVGLILGIWCVGVRRWLFYEGDVVNAGPDPGIEEHIAHIECGVKADFRFNWTCCELLGPLRHPELVQGRQIKEPNIINLHNDGRVGHGPPIDHWQIELVPAARLKSNILA